MAIKFTDNAYTKLAADVTSTDTIITLQAGTGQLFPAVDGVSGDYFVITLEDSAGNREFVRVDYRQGDTLGSATYPCQRGYWSSTAQAFSASNTTVAVRLSVNALDRAIADHTQWATKADKVSPATAGNLAGLDATGNLTDSGVTFGTGANNVLQLDTSGLVPLANIPAVLTGKDADTVDGAHAGTGPSNVLQLDTSGLVPLANIPAVLTGKDADTVDGMHLADLDARYVNVSGDTVSSITVSPTPPGDGLVTQGDDLAHWALFNGLGTSRLFDFYTPSGANAGNLYVRTDVGGATFEVLRFRPDGGLDFGDPTQNAPGHIFQGSDGGYAEFRYGSGWRGRIRADATDGLFVEVFDGTSWKRVFNVPQSGYTSSQQGSSGSVGHVLRNSAGAAEGDVVAVPGGYTAIRTIDTNTGSVLGGVWVDKANQRIYMQSPVSGGLGSFLYFENDGRLWSSRLPANNYTRITPNFCYLVTTPSNSPIDNVSVLGYQPPSGAIAVLLELHNTTVNNIDVVFYYSGTPITTVTIPPTSYVQAIAPVSGSLFYMKASAAGAYYTIPGYWD